MYGDRINRTSNPCAFNQAASAVNAGQFRRRASARQARSPRESPRLRVESRRAAVASAWSASKSTTTTPRLSTSSRPSEALKPRSQSLVTTSARLTLESKAPGRAPATWSALGSFQSNASSAELSRTASLNRRRLTPLRQELVHRTGTRSGASLNQGLCPLDRNGDGFQHPERRRKPARRPFPPTVGRARPGFGQG